MLYFNTEVILCTTEFISYKSISVSIHSLFSISICYNQALKLKKQFIQLQQYKSNECSYYTFIKRYVTSRIPEEIRTVMFSHLLWWK